jgi:hypothetical protein
MKTYGEILKNNLRGQDYVKARGLVPVALYLNICPHCQGLERLAQVERLTTNWRKNHEN